VTAPLSTCRLQLEPGFGFARAAARVDYLRRLGISHLYLSPIAEARAGSPRGYDVTDPNRVRAELGGREAFERLAGVARGAGLGVIIDMVPNHLAASIENPWWRETLEKGRDADAAAIFDIDWDAGGGGGAPPTAGRKGGRGGPRGGRRSRSSRPKPRRRQPVPALPVTAGSCARVRRPGTTSCCRRWRR